MTTQTPKEHLIIIHLALHLQILKLEERIESLVSRISSSESTEVIEKDVSSLKVAKLEIPPTGHMSSTQPVPRGKDLTTIFLEAELIPGGVVPMHRLQRYWW